jgi:hypothetical protein
MDLEPDSVLFVFAIYQYLQKLRDIDRDDQVSRSIEILTNGMNGTLAKLISIIFNSVNIVITDFIVCT